MFFNNFHSCICNNESISQPIQTNQNLFTNNTRKLSISTKSKEKFDEHYTLFEQIGKGGFSTVKLAQYNYQYD
jgi:hypothetical protein